MRKLQGYNRSVIFIMVMVHIWKLTNFFTISIFNTVVLITKSCLTVCSHMDCSPPGSFVHGKFSRQEYWSGLPFPTPGDFSNLESNSRLLNWQMDSLPMSYLGSPFSMYYIHQLGFPDGLASIESPCNVGDLGLIPGLGRFPGKANGYPLQYSCLENSIDCIVHGVAKSLTRLSSFHLYINYISII